MGAFTLQAEIDEYGDLLDTALEECKRRGDACALAEAEYYSAKARAVRGMVADGQKATLIPLLVKGDPTVNKALEKWRRLEVAYDNAKESDKDTYAEDSATLREGAFYTSVDSSIADWLFDSARTEGDTTYIVSDSGVYYVLYYISRSTNEYQLPNVRHILISVSDTTDEAAMEEARTKAESILTEYEAGEHTADAFGALAKEYTDDSNGDEGGLYENITPGQMVTEFNDWCFDESRQPGDTGIVETSYGVHVMYFDSFGNSYRNTLVENALRTADYNAWHDGVVGDNAFTTNSFGMKFITK